MDNCQEISYSAKSSKDKTISICVFLSGFSCFAQLYYFQPLLPDLATQFNLSASYSSLAISFSTLGMVIGLFTAMFVADSIPRKKLISAALLSSSVASVICSYSNSFFLLVALSALKGFLLSGATSVSLAYISEEVLPKNGTSSRNVSILRLTDLTDRVLQNLDDVELASKQIDFGRVNDVMGAEREKSLAQLKSMIEE